MKNLTHFPDDDPRTKTLARRMADPGREARRNAIPDTDFDTLPLKALAEKHNLPDLDPIETASVIGPRLDAKVERARAERAREARKSTAEPAPFTQHNPLQQGTAFGDPVNTPGIGEDQRNPVGSLPNPGAGLNRGTVVSGAIFAEAPRAGSPPRVEPVPGHPSAAGKPSAGLGLDLGGNTPPAAPAQPAPAPQASFGAFFRRELERHTGKPWDVLVRSGQDVIAAALRPQSVLQGNLPGPAPQNLPRTAPPPDRSFRAAQDVGIASDGVSSGTGGVMPLAMIPIAEFTPDAVEALKTGLEIFETFIEGNPPPEEFVIVGPGGEGSPDLVQMSEGLKLLVEFTPIGAAFGVAKAYVDYRRAIANGDKETARTKGIELLTEIGTSLIGPLGKGASKTAGIIGDLKVGKRLQRVVRKLKWKSEVKEVWAGLDDFTKGKLELIGSGKLAMRSRDAIVHALKDAKNVRNRRAVEPNFAKPGGLEAAKRDFFKIIDDAGGDPKKVNPFPSNEIDGQVIFLPDGTHIAWRNTSSDGLPTIEVQVELRVDDRLTVLKIRYTVEP